MDVVFVVPGIMGSELYLHGERIWPPSVLHPHVKDPENLLDAQVRVGDLIRRVIIFGFYDKLLQPLENWGYWEGHGGPRGIVVPWPYNWVHGIPQTARRLAADIRDRLEDHPDHHDVVLLAHSMGGLICTYALECLAEQDPSWRKRVRLFVTFGTPFLGAPESLLNAFGLEGVQGIRADDCQALMADPRFPSAYQLFPHLHTLASWESSAPLSPIGSYQQLAPYGPTLGPQNLRAAHALQLDLQAAKPNPLVRKFNFCGTSNATAWAVKRAASAGGSIDSISAKAGDGTVPSWSGRQDGFVQFAPLGEKHATTFGARDLLDTLQLLLTHATPPAGPGGGGGLGGGGPGRGPSGRTPVFQPRVSVARNAISSQRTEVEVEISEATDGGVLSLAWLGASEVETPEDLAALAARSGHVEVHPMTSLHLDAALDFPMTIQLQCPPDIGQFVLAAWSGDSPVKISELSSDRMDLVWRFADHQERGEAIAQPAGNTLELEDLFEEAAKPAEEAQDGFLGAKQLQSFEE